MNGIRFLQIAVLCGISMHCRGMIEELSRICKTGEENVSALKPEEYVSVALANNRTANVSNAEIAHTRTLMEGVGVVPFFKELCQANIVTNLEIVLRTVKPEISDEDKHEILLAASKTNNITMVDLLWKNNFRFLTKDYPPDIKRAALKILLLHNNKAVIDYFLEVDKSINHNQLYLDAIETRSRLAYDLIKSPSVELHARDIFKPWNTALHIAAMHNVEFMKALLNNVKPLEPDNARLADCQILTAGNAWGSTPLHCAAATGQIEAVKLLLALKVPVNILDYLRNTPLIRAARSGYPSVAEELVNKGANIEHTNRDDHSALTVKKDAGVSDAAHTAVVIFLKAWLDKKKQAQQ